MMRPRSRLRLTQVLALSGMIVAGMMVAGHARAGFIEAEMLIPALLLLSSYGLADALERQGSLPLAPLIAIVGCDGSGKSTLSTDLQRTFAANRPTEMAYLGLGSGELGNRIARWPIVGRLVERKLAGKAMQARDKEKKIPGLPTALVVYGFSLLRVRRFRQVLALRERGVAVITDRYPQTEIAGFYDGPGLSAAKAGSPIVAWLAARERRMYDWMASFRPDVVLRLNVDAETALARKPDHNAVLLRQKVAATPLLRFNGARIFEIDAAASYDQVRPKAFAQVQRVLMPNPQTPDWPVSPVPIGA